MSQSRDNDAILLAFQAWWDQPIENMLSDEFDPITYDYSALYRRLEAQLEQDQLACETYVNLHDNISTLSPHQLSILGTIYLNRKHNNAEIQQQLFEKAKTCFEEAKKDNAWALHCIGFMYHDGLSVTRDLNQARSYYEQTAANGCAESLNNLGFMYNHGEGVTQDIGQALNYYRQAATKNNMAALYSLARMHQEGRGIAKDFNKALNYFKQAATKGHVLALYQLGCMYWHGKGVTEDSNQAINYFRQSAAKGHAFSIHSIGMMYMFGLGVAEDLNQAALYFRQAYQKEKEHNLDELNSLYRNDPDNPIILYHVAIATRDVEMIAELKDAIKTDPQSFVYVAMQDSMQVLRDILGNNDETNNFIRFVTNVAAERIAPYFDTVFKSTDLPSDLVSTVLSYVGDEPIAPRFGIILQSTNLPARLASTILSYADVNFSIHEDYAKQAIEINRIAVGKKFPVELSDQQKNKIQQQEEREKLKFNFVAKIEKQNKAAIAAAKEKKQQTTSSNDSSSYRTHKNKK